MFQLGPFVIQYEMLLVFISVALGVSFLRYFSPMQHRDDKAIREVVYNGLLTLFVTMQFGTLVMRPELLVTDPLSAIAYPSGRQELWLATIIVMVYFLYASWRHQHALQRIFIGLLLVLIPAEMVYVTVQSTGVETLVYLSGFALILWKIFQHIQKRWTGWIGLGLWALLQLIAIVGFQNPFLFHVVIHWSFPVAVIGFVIVMILVDAVKSLPKETKGG
ncbi:hypothetical protein [Geomicrobium sediminis]|uniref:Prolipoprotein diacylglyceryl transferase n=1 Tax=Geomicrobium sediminis TaxID=1347788 RepID=A0ABS2P8M9_9BACL|nr:hypothetical protein [Geomicrobium sediminis]MBM7631486.1 hypothetical protein [Geomicrobium sediminis]